MGDRREPLAAPWWPSVEWPICLDSSREAPLRRKQLLWKRALGAATFLIFLAVIPAAFVWGTLAEHSRRERVLNQGETASAVVARSDDQGDKRLCKVEYRLNHAGSFYAGNVVSCELMERHPKGSLIEVRYEAGRPDQSLAVGDHLWPPMTVAAVLLSAAWLFVAVLIAFILGQTALSQVSSRTRLR